MDNKKLYWGIYDEISVMNLKLKGNKPILIRALEPEYFGGKEPYKIKNKDKYVDILELFFVDLITEEPEKYKDEFILFNKEMSKELENFILSNDFDEIVVHCSAGISRSSALMICISKIINRYDIEKEIMDCGRFFPNEYVLKVFNQTNKLNTNKYKDHKTENTRTWKYSSGELDVLLDNINLGGIDDE